MLNLIPPVFAVAMLLAASTAHSEPVVPTATNVMPAASAEKLSASSMAEVAGRVLTLFTDPGNSNSLWAGTARGPLPAYALVGGVPQAATSGTCP